MPACVVLWNAVSFTLCSQNRYDILFWKGLAHSYCKCEIRFVEKYAVAWGPTLCNGDGTRSRSKLPLFSATRSSRWGSEAQQFICCQRSVFAVHAVISGVKPWSWAYSNFSSPLSVPTPKEFFLLGRRTGSPTANSICLMFPRDWQWAWVTVHADSPTETFCMCSDRIDAVMWSWRSTNNESVLLLLRAHAWQLQGGLKSCRGRLKFWIKMRSVGDSWGIPFNPCFRVCWGCSQVCWG